MSILDPVFLQRVVRIRVRSGVHSASWFGGTFRPYVIRGIGS